MSEPISSTNPEKFFLAFGFSQFAPEDLRKFHMTAMHFGPLSDDEVKKVIKTVGAFVAEDDLWFSANHSLDFKIEDMFGRNKDIRVLKPDPEHHLTKILINSVNDLRDALSIFQKHKDFTFNPHIATDLKYLRNVLPCRLFLCGKSYRIVETWKL